MAVAIWNHEPTSAELLTARLGHGWHPTPTDTVEGAVVLGHAACLVTGAQDNRPPSVAPHRGCG